MTTLVGSWDFTAIDGADVRLRSGDIGVMNVDITAPLRQGSLRIVAGKASLALVIALDQLRTGNFLTEHAARAFIAGYRAHDLVYDGGGAAKKTPFQVSGQAKAGQIDVSIALSVSLLGGDQPTEAELTGSASFGRVHIPIPGVGTVDDLNIDIDARLALVSAAVQ
jgi:hypothetical protein